MMNPTKIRILFSILALALAVLSAGCSAFVAPTPTPNAFTAFHSPDGLFSLSVPTGWVPSSKRSPDGTLNQYKFIAPDQRGFIQVVVAIRDQPVSNEIADAFILRVLQSYVVATDGINITGDRTAANGQRTLTWHAKQGLMGGSALVERPDTKLIMLTVSNLDAANLEYQSLFEHVLATYKAK
jgi:hypothetical protein